MAVRFTQPGEAGRDRTAQVVPLPLHKVPDRWLPKCPLSLDPVKSLALLFQRVEPLVQFGQVMKFFV